MKQYRASRFAVCLLVSSVLVFSCVSAGFAAPFSPAASSAALRSSLAAVESGLRAPEGAVLGAAAVSPVLRAHMLKSFQAAPKYRSKPSLSPGGTNRLVFKYALSGEAEVHIELLKDGAWQPLLIQADTAGTRTFIWDGRSGGSYLSPGAYAVRAYSLFQGLQSAVRMLTVNIFPAPTLNVALAKSYFKAGSGKAALTVKMNVLSDLRVTILDQSGAVIATVFSKANVPPGTKKINWTGKNDSKTYVAPGDYYFRVSAGGTADILIPVKVTPPLLATLVFPTLANLHVMVRDGATPGALSKGALWDELTAYPGTAGNCAVFGHRTTVFKTFGGLKLGDPIQFYIGSSVLNYRIVNMLVVSPNDPMMYQSYTSRMMTLVTCFPFIWKGHAPQRYIVIAEQVD
jgi:LPXTG-site transpeptidase (sortase) family protein